MNYTGPEVKTLDADQDRAIAQLFGAALFDDPLARFACPDPGLRSAWLPSSFLGFLDLGHAEGEIIGAGNPLSGAAIARRIETPPEAESMPSETMHPLDERLFEQIVAAESRLHAAFPGPHWFLDVISVLPQQQGRGIGGSLIQNVIARAENEKLPILLVTWQPRNLAFYRKHGFKVACEGDGPDDGPHWWGFVRSFS